MLQSQAVSKLVNRHPIQIDTVCCLCREMLVIVEMSITGETCINIYCLILPISSRNIFTFIVIIPLIIVVVVSYGISCE